MKHCWDLERGRWGEGQEEGERWCLQLCLCGRVIEKRKFRQGHILTHKFPAVFGYAGFCNTILDFFWYIFAIFVKFISNLVPHFFCNLWISKNLPMASMCLFHVCKLILAS